MNTLDEVLDGWADGTVADSTSSVNRARAWQVGDRVRVVGGSRLLLGATGTVVEIEALHAWQVRVDIDRAGFSRALLAAHELEPVSSTPVEPHGIDSRPKAA